MFSHVHAMCRRHRETSQTAGTDLVFILCSSAFSAYKDLQGGLGSAHYLKYLSLSSLNSLVSACVTEDVLVAGYTLRGSPSQEAF